MCYMFGTVCVIIDLMNSCDIPDSYKAIAKLINNFLNWLYDNVEELSEELIK